MKKSFYFFAALAYISTATALSCYSNTCKDSECDAFDLPDDISQFSKACPETAKGCKHSVQTVKKGEKSSKITTTRECWSTGDTTDEVGTCSDSSIGPELYAVETKTCVCEADNCNGKGAPNAKGTGAPDKPASAAGSAAPSPEVLIVFQAPAPLPLITRFTKPSKAKIVPVHKPKKIRRRPAPIRNIGGGWGSRKNDGLRFLPFSAGWGLKTLPILSTGSEPSRIYFASSSFSGGRGWGW